MNPYDISKECDGPIQETLCYPITKSIFRYLQDHTLMLIRACRLRYINWYLSQQEVRDSLGVDPSITGNFTSCSSVVGSAFRANLDGYHPTYHYVAALLERGVRTLIYVGAYDWICNWVRLSFHVLADYTC